MSIDGRVRSGLAGYWDRFVGPQPSRIEQLGTLGAVVAAARWGDAALGPYGPIRFQRVLVRLVAMDLWGGAWVNNTRACVRWYERPGQGAREHFDFAALHLLHPALIAGVDSSARKRSRASAIAWTLGHYGWLLASAVVISSAPRRRRLVISIAATGAGIRLDRLLGPSDAAPWFAPVYYTKLLIGHAAGSLWNAGQVPIGG